MNKVDFDAMLPFIDMMTDVVLYAFKKRGHDPTPQEVVRATMEGWMDYMTKAQRAKTPNVEIKWPVSL